MNYSSDIVADAVRVVVFDAKTEEYDGEFRALLGGTAFIINYHNSIYVVTCKHVIAGAHLDKVLISDRRIGIRWARLKEEWHNGELAKDAEGTSINDILIYTTKDPPDFFHNTAYRLNTNTFTQSSASDRLFVYGYFHSESCILGEEMSQINPVFCELELEDVGQTSSDLPLREAHSKVTPFPSSLDGLSGSPVYNITRNALCGMATRGAINENGECIVWYIDFAYIEKSIEAIHQLSHKEPQ